MVRSRSLLKKAATAVETGSVRTFACVIGCSPQFHVRRSIKARPLWVQRSCHDVPTGLSGRRRLSKWEEGEKISPKECRSVNNRHAGAEIVQNVVMTRAANSRPTGSNSRPFGRPHRRPNVGTVGASREAHKASGRSAPQGGAFMLSIKRELERKRSALKVAIHSSMDSNRDTDHFRELAKDPYGSASLTHDDEIAAAVVDRRARELQQVNSALEDIEAGRYGVCRDCGEEIAEARLRVLPFATRCVACQAELETIRRAA
ncbi:MAG: hypothetical protein DMD90_19215 [Candidatus Rokuibacteriota bacterium]|nr:MAG: hypothetical protein DMD90_19215 [Candidatus Rokubacteria bacterium]